MQSGTTVEFQTVPHLVRVVSLRVPVPQIGTPALTGIGFSGSTVWNSGSETRGVTSPDRSLLSPCGVLLSASTIRFFSSYKPSGEACPYQHFVI